MGVSLLAASSGGHVSELHVLRPLLIDDAPRLWVTFRTEQTESLLEGEDVVWLDYIPPRGLSEIAQAQPQVRSLLREYPVESVYSTGSAIALAVFPQARSRGLPCTYIESAARSTGPSTTGRLIGLLPGVTRFTQYPDWAGRRWQYFHSVFDAFSVRDAPPVPVRRVLVTLGTIRPFGFARLVRRMIDIVPPDVEVICQLGSTQVSGPVPANFSLVGSMSAAALYQHTRDADVVVAHAGIGSALMALQCGKRPVLAIRRQDHGEHVDDHQEQIALEMGRRGLATVREADRLTWAEVCDSTLQRVDLAPSGDRA